MTPSRPAPSARTQDEHLQTLYAMLADHEYMCNMLSHRARPSRLAKVHGERADALRWILNETAYPIDEETVR